MDDFMQLFPHISKEEIPLLFFSCRDIACPPVFVNDTVHILSLHYYINKDRILRREFTAHQNDPMMSIYPYSYGKNAIYYARDHWGSALTQANWENVVRVFIKDPSDHLLYGQPRLIAVLTIALNRNFIGILYDHSKPAVELIDESLVAITLNNIEGREILGDKGYDTAFNCSLCGSGLGLNSCPRCGHEFTDDILCHGRSVPLSRKMVAYLKKNGHHFTFDPEQA